MKPIELNKPIKYTIIGKKDMKYVEGGSYSMQVSTSFLNKYQCVRFADYLFGYNLVTGMSALSIAQEMYAHAIGYYYALAFEGIGLSSSIIDYLRQRGGQVDIEDGGDTWFRQYGYSLVWNAIK